MLAYYLLNISHKKSNIVRCCRILHHVVEPTLEENN